MKIYQAKYWYTVFDYEDDKVDLDEYELVYENSKYDEDSLDDIYMYFNLWEDNDGKIEQTFRDLSVGDIVELRGKFFKHRLFGWEDMTDKIESRIVLVAKEDF